MDGMTEANPSDNGHRVLETTGHSGRTPPRTCGANGLVLLSHPQPGCLQEPLFSDINGPRRDPTTLLRRSALRDTTRIHGQQTRLGAKGMVYCRAPEGEFEASLAMGFSTKGLSLIESQGQRAS